jgi:hypothetical protein
MTMFETWILGLLAILTTFPIIGGQTQPAASADGWKAKAKSGEVIAEIDKNDGIYINSERDYWVHGTHWYCEPVEIETDPQLVLIGPLPLAEMFKSGQCPSQPLDAAITKSPELAAKLLEQLRSMEVYIIDRKCRSSRGDFVFCRDTHEFPKLLVTPQKGFASSGANWTLELVKPAAGKAVDQKLATDPNAGRIRRQIQIKVSLPDNLATGTPSGSCLLNVGFQSDAGLMGNIILQAGLENEYLSGPILYNTEGKVCNDPAQSQYNLMESGLREWKCKNDEPNWEETRCPPRRY